MAALVAKPKDTAALLNHLIELGLDTIVAYEAAIDRVDDLDDRAHFEELRGDHERQVHDLQSLVTELGEKPVDAPDIMRVVKKGKVMLASLIGDRIVLLAMKVNEHDMLVAFERTLERSDLPRTVREALVRAREEERRHVGGLEQRLVDFDVVETETYTPPRATDVEAPAPSVR